uniref:Uncharacterized protein n=1 Tax=Anopheles arabiensis TaxID=7173 RepID=A0A182IGC3_ANOAR
MHKKKNLPNDVCVLTIVLLLMFVYSSIIFHHT